MAQAAVNHKSLVLKTAGVADQIPFPKYGDQHVNSDTGEVLYWYGDLYGWTPAWNTPWGIQSFAQLTAPVSFISVTVASDLTQSFVPVPNRRYRVSFDGYVRADSASYIPLRIDDQLQGHTNALVGGTVWVPTVLWLPAENPDLTQQAFPVSFSRVLGFSDLVPNRQPTPTTVTLQLSGQNNSNSQLWMNAVLQTSMSCTDIGPSGPPIVN